jgi:hypothetical protein
MASSSLSWNESSWCSRSDGAGWALAGAGFAPSSALGTRLDSFADRGQSALL